MVPQPAGAASKPAPLQDVVEMLIVEAGASADGGGGSPLSVSKRQRRTPVTSPEGSPGEAAAPWAVTHDF